MAGSAAVGEPALGSVASPGLTGAMAELVRSISSALGTSPREELALAEIPALLRQSLSAPALLTAPQRAFDPDKYARHLIYADPGGRFSVLALAWLPGQCTPVHGHNAWGVVGVHDGNMENTCYSVTLSDARRPAGRRSCQASAPYQPTGAQPCGVGRVVSVAAGDAGAHSLRNPGPGPAHTIHVYGMDLAAEPLGINRYYD